MNDTTTPNWFVSPPANDQPGSESPLSQSRYLRPGGAVDTVGLVSTGNFSNGNVVSTGPYNFSTSDTYTDITGATITMPDIPRTANVYISYSANIQEDYLNTVTVFSGGIVLNIDGVDKTGTIFEAELHDLIHANSGTENGWGGPVSASSVISLTAGVHILKLRAKTFNTNQRLTVFSASITYLVLGS